MTANQYLTDFYNQYDEDNRLAYRHGSVEFLTTMRYIENTGSPGTEFLKSEPGPDGIPTHWHVRAMPWTRWN